MIFERNFKITPMRMFVFITGAILSFFVSCGTSHRYVPTVKEPIIMSSLAYIPLQSDTPKFKQPGYELDRARITETVVKNITVSNIDTLRQLNEDLQRIAIRTLDRAHEVRLEKDSSLELLKKIRDTVNATKAQSKVAKVNAQIVSTYDQVFNSVIAGCLAICTLSSLVFLFGVRKKKSYIA